MTPFKTLMLLVWASLAILATAASTGGTITVYGPDELNSEVAREFLACLEQTGKDYKIYVDDGTVIVIPAESRATDFKGEDKALYECIRKVNALMEVAIESTQYDQEEHRAATSSKSVTYEWLSEQGALGRKPVGTRPGSTRQNGDEMQTGRSLVYWAFFVGLHLSGKTYRRWSSYLSGTLPSSVRSVW